MVDNQIHHGGYFNPPWWILEFTKFTCFILMICIFIFQQTQKQDGGYLNPQNKWNVGSDAFIIAQNINHKRERGVLLKATLFILTKLKMIDPYRHWRTSTDFNMYFRSKETFTVLFSGYYFRSYITISFHVQKVYFLNFQREMDNWNGNKRASK